MDRTLLPVFPLNVVLLPEEVLPLYIFEERYKQMIGECLEAKAQHSKRQEFGIVLARGNGIPVAASFNVGRAVGVSSALGAQTLPLSSAVSA